MRTFELETKIGKVFFRVTAEDQIFVETRGETNQVKTESPVTIRGKQFTGHVRFGWHITRTEWDGLTYDHDGNTIVFVFDKGGEYFKSRAVWLSIAGGFQSDNATHAAKLKFYDEVKSSLNAFYKVYKTEIDAECFARRLEKAETTVETLRTSVNEQRAKLIETEKELYRAENALIGLRAEPPITQVVNWIRWYKITHNCGLGEAVAARRQKQEGIFPN